MFDPILGVEQVSLALVTIALANGLEIKYETFGNPEDPPVLLIMGLGGQLIAWDLDFCGALADRGYFVIRFDNRDAGLSEKIPGGKIDVRLGRAGISRRRSLGGLVAVFRFCHLGLLYRNLSGATSFLP